MHISLTPELEQMVKDRISSGLYNNASEVIRESLRFMLTHDELVYQMKLQNLKDALRKGEEDFRQGRVSQKSVMDITETLIRE